MKAFNIFCVFVIFSLYGCRHTESIKELPATVLSVNDPKSYVNFATRKLGEVVNDLHFVKLSTRYGSQGYVADISQVFLIDKIIYAVDKKLHTLKAYDQQGEFLFNVGKMGGLPSQFRDITAVTFDSTRKRLILYSIYSRAFFEYDLQGNFIKSTKVKFLGEKLASLPPYQFLFYTGLHRNQEVKTNNLLVLDTNYQIVKLKFPSTIKKVDGLFGESGGIATGANGYLFTEPLSDTIIRMDDHAESKKSYIVKFNKKLPEKLRQDFNAYISEGLSYSTLFNNIMETDSLLIFRYASDYKIHLGIYDKLLNKFITGDNLVYDLAMEMIAFPVAEDNDRFVSVCYPQAMIAKIKNKKEQAIAFSSEFPNLYDALNTMDEDDGPFLLFYNIKHPSALL